MRRFDLKVMLASLGVDRIPPSSPISAVPEGRVVDLDEHDRCLLEGIERGLEALHVDVCHVEAELLSHLASQREFGLGDDCVVELSAALDQLADLRGAAREMRARVATLSG